MTKKTTRTSKARRPAPLTLHEARLQVMAEVPYIRKSRSGGLNYTFMSEAELISAMHPAMRKAGLTVSPLDVAVVSESEYRTARTDTRMAHVRAVVTYRFVAGGGSEHEDVRVLAEAADSGDKSSSKLMTMAMKYALRQFFLIETGDDPDTVAHQRSNQRDAAFDRAVIEIQKAGDLQALEVVRTKAQQTSPQFKAELEAVVASRRSELNGANG